MRCHIHPPGFTLVELMAVVVLLGILVAVTVPQLTVASNDAREGALAANLAGARRQIALYIAEHNGRGPHLDENGRLSPAELSARMLGKTDADGTLNPDGPHGPYLIRWPPNPFCDDDVARKVQIGRRRCPPRTGRTGWYYCCDTAILCANSTRGGERFDPESPAPRRRPARQAVLRKFVGVCAPDSRWLPRRPMQAMP